MVGLARAPDRLGLPPGQGLVGHRHALVVAGAGVPAEVGAGGERVDLVVAVGPVLDADDGPVGRTLGEALHVAVPVGVDQPLAGVGRVGERVVGQRPAGAAVHAQHLAAERGEGARVGGVGGVAGADVQRLGAGVEQHPAAAVAAAGRRQAGDHVAHQARPARVAAELPQRDADVVPAAGPPALAGPEAPGAVEGRVDGERHQAGLAADPDLGAREADRTPLALAHHAEPGPVALGDEEPAAADGLDVPRVDEPADDGADPQAGCLRARCRCLDLDRGDAARGLPGEGRWDRRERAEPEGGGQDEDGTDEASWCRRYVVVPTPRGPARGAGGGLRRCARGRGRCRRGRRRRTRAQRRAGRRGRRRTA